MKLIGQYKVVIEMQDIYIPSNSTEEEIRGIVVTIGRDNLKKYFNDALFDPDKKVTFEDISIKIKET